MIGGAKHVLYGTASNARYSTLPPGTLVALDARIGATTPVGLTTLKTTGGVGVSGLAFSSQGELFASLASRSAASTLIQVGPDSGELIREIDTITTYPTAIC